MQMITKASQDRMRNRNWDFPLSFNSQIHTLSKERRKMSFGSMALSIFFIIQIKKKSFDKVQPRK